VTIRLRWRPRRWSHWTLRSRLVLVVGLLAALGLIVADVAGLLLIRSYLQNRIDDQLVAMSRPLSNGLRPEGPQPIRARFLRLGGDQVVYVYLPDGTVDGTRSSAADSTRPPVAPYREVARRAQAGTPYTVEASDASAHWRLLAVPVADTGAVAVLGASLVEVEQTSDQLLLIDSAVTVLVLLLLALLAAFVVRLGLRPLTDMARLATDISAGNLSGRVAGADPHTEPGRLGLALNSMLSRIEAEVFARTSSEQRLRQFVADASHELRTPLTSIRGFAELYRRGGARPARRWTRRSAGSRAKPAGWACWSRICCCWPGWTGGGRPRCARSTCWRSPRTPSGTRTPEPRTARYAWPA
jgi:two-component system OmpR family sensor kinase